MKRIEREIAPDADAAKKARDILAEAVVALERMQWQHQQLHAENGRLRGEVEALRRRHYSSGPKASSKPKKIG